MGGPLNYPIIPREEPRSPALAQIRERYKPILRDLVDDSVESIQLEKVTHTFKKTAGKAWKSSATFAAVSYTISRDHTSGECARQAKLLSEFGQKIQSKKFAFNSPLTPSAFPLPPLTPPAVTPPPTRPPQNAYPLSPTPESKGAAARLIEEQAKLILLMSSKNTDTSLIQMQQGMVRIVQKLAIEEQQLATKEVKKPKPAKPANKSRINTWHPMKTDANAES
jgi:hypothetical protein